MGGETGWREKELSRSAPTGSARPLSAEHSSLPDRSLLLPMGRPPLALLHATGLASFLQQLRRAWGRGAVTPWTGRSGPVLPPLCAQGSARRTVQGEGLWPQDGAVSTGWSRPPPPRARGSARRTGWEACTGRDGRSWSGQKPGEGWEQPGLRRSTRRVRKAGLHSPPACCRDGAQSGGSRERCWPRAGRCRWEHRVCRAGLGGGRLASQHCRCS